MKFSTILTTSVAGASAFSFWPQSFNAKRETGPQPISLSLSKNTGKIPGYTGQKLNKRASIANGSLTISSDYAGYLATIQVGTPAQSISLILDTGSPLLWMNNQNVSLYTQGSSSSSSSTKTSSAGICGKNVECFNPNSSSTFVLPSNSTIFDIAYVDGSSSIGRIVEDTIVFEGLSSTQQFGLVEYQAESSGESASDLPAGIIGLSPQTAIASFPSFQAAMTASESATSFEPQTILDQLVAQGKIASQAYSLYLDDLGTGSLLLGGVDTEKYTGNLTVVPIVDSDSSNPSLSVSLLGVGANANASSVVTLSNVDPTLDSGTTALYIPTQAVQDLATSLGGQLINAGGGQAILSVPCSLTQGQDTIDFYFANNGVVRVPLSELYEGKEGSLCLLGVFGTDSEDEYLLGDSFLRSAYVVYDYPNSEIAIAQSSYNNAQSNVVAIGTGMYGIPNGVYNSSSPASGNSLVIPSITSAVQDGTVTGTSAGVGVRTSTVATGSHTSSTSQATSSSQKSDARSALDLMSGYGAIATLGLSLFGAFFVIY